jgi:hypothetical protein
MIGDWWEDYALLTATVKRNIEDESAASPGSAQRGFDPGTPQSFAFYGANIAPSVSIQSRASRMRISDVNPYGLGQFKAKDASPPLWKTQPKVREEAIELVLLEEMERFGGEEWMLLNSTDPRIQAGAALSLVDRLSIMFKRNDRLTEWMRWQAFKGGFSVTFPDGGTEVYDYQFSASHLPTAGIAWTDHVNSDPVEDIFAWQQVGADDAGQYYPNVHLNSNTLRDVQLNEKIAGTLSSYGRTIMRPTLADINSLMRQGTNWQIIDEGYLPDNATNRRLTKFLPDNRVLLTTTYQLFGTNIADVADGQVLVGGDGNTAPSIAQGIQSEVMTNPFTKNTFRRVASARMVRLYWPEAFLYAATGA